MIHRIVKHTKSSGALVVAEKTGKALVGYLPRTVELHQMRTPVRRMLILVIELLMGMLVLGAILLGLFYYRLEKGAIDLNFVVPSIESAINEQLTDISVKIDSAFVGKNTHSAGVHFRLRNIVLYNKEGETIANAPLAAVDLNGRALMWGRIAPSQVVFIKPTLEVTYSEDKGFSLSYPRNNAGPGNNSSGDVIANLLNGMGGSHETRTQIADVSKTVTKIAFMKAVSAAFKEARSYRNTTSYLTQFGVRDATVNFSSDSVSYSWKMPDFIIDLKHSDKGSLIRGFGKLGIGDEEKKITPWKVRFQTQQFDDTQNLQLDLGFNDITPKSLQHLLPHLAKLKLFNIPFSGKVNAKLNKFGELQSAFANFHLAAGKITIPWLNMKEDGIEDLRLDIGEIGLAYSHKGKKLHILPSPVKWGNNSTILSGRIEADAQSGDVSKWKFILKGNETRLAADDFSLGPMIVDEWWITGSISPQEDLLEIAGFYLRAGSAVINIKGHINNIQSSPGVYLQGKVSSISVPVFKRLWPTILAVGARKWVGKSLLEGKVVSGDFNIAIPPGIVTRLPDQADLSPEMVQLNFNLRDLVIEYISGLVPVTIPDATVKISGRQVSVVAAKGRVYFSREVPLRVSHGSYTISDLRKKHPDSDLNFRIAGKARDLMQFIQQPTLKLSRQMSLPGKRIDGNLKGVISMHIPLIKNLKFKDIALNGDLRLRDMKGEKLFDGVSVDGGTINLKVSTKAVEAEGGVVLRGIPVKLNWQYIFNAGNKKQPPVRLSAVLNKASRKKIGLAATNEILQGDVPVVVTITPQGKKNKTIQVRADLTNAKVSNTAIGWSKSPGVAAVLQFDITKGRPDIIKLRNFSLVGDQLVLEGALSFNGQTKRIDAFYFPRVSFQSINSMSLSGKRQKNGILGISARVDSLDGRQLLRRRFFNQSKTLKTKSKSDNKSNYDLYAQIKTIVGGKNTYIKNAKIDIRQRDGKLSWLDFKGHLNGQSMIAALLENNKREERVLKVESTDAGATFRMIGLYPNIQGGQLSLQVDMDPKGTTEKTGTLWVKNFFVINSQKIDREMNSSDIFKNKFIEQARTRKSRKRPKIMRTRIQFDRLKAPFSYGDGQFILHDSYVNGPVIGATLRGKIDFRTERMRLGGTYVPLYGLNSAIGEIPVLSDLFVGRQGEGVFGVTFAIEGSTAKPTVIVNPVSLLTPGVFRQIFDFNNSVREQQFRKLPKIRRKLRRNRKRRRTGNYP
jgi:hypothetical protein